ncbi:hypothetical protein ACWIUH_05560 [Ursidibacter arcticus]
MKNGLNDLVNHLFASMERLNDENLTPEQIQTEVARSKAISETSQQIINIAEVELKAIKAREMFLDNNSPLPKIFHDNSPLPLTLENKENA